MENFENELRALVNKYNWDTSLDIPDYIIAAYLVSSLNNLKITLDTATNWKDN